MPDDILTALKEREKELACLYHVHQLMKDEGIKHKTFFKKLLKIMPAGWQFPALCSVKIEFEGNTFREDDFTETRQFIKAPIYVFDAWSGEISVYYEKKRDGKTPDFLPEEQHLLNTIAENIGQHFFSERLKSTMHFLKIPAADAPNHDDLKKILLPSSTGHSEWRLRMVHSMAEKLEFETYGVFAIYVIGSVKTMQCGPASDIDILLHYDGVPMHQALLQEWFRGWSLCLSEINFARTGYQTDSLVDLHLITDKDITDKTSFAVMIGSRFNSARKIK